ncbi:hypothetical protein [Erythrobacter sp. THAF29]|uniref:hypothetical protein n=1 Tax=Erythrobacter sp. THAF29 TaxID=2587851 RepID=UPI0012678864|nr:hypothetical protein [Erythrobacter sp. THAF29]QFT76286.1 hypothetical protein FIU90_01900 [Erythrobacter sp. THAF29]
MFETPTHSRPHSVYLEAGAQAVINGALVTAVEPCRFEVGAGAYVFSGRALWRDRASGCSPHQELYFSALEAAAGQGSLLEARFRLFQLLGHVVTSTRTLEGQRECSRFASALIDGDIEEVVACASRLASLAASNSRPGPRKRVPGRPGETRHRVVQRAEP